MVIALPVKRLVIVQVTVISYTPLNISAFLPTAPATMTSWRGSCCFCCKSISSVWRRASSSCFLASVCQLDRFGERRQVIAVRVRVALTTLSKTSRKLLIKWHLLEQDMSSVCHFYVRHHNLALCFSGALLHLGQHQVAEQEAYSASVRERYPGTSPLRIEPLLSTTRTMRVTYSRASRASLSISLPSKHHEVISCLLDASVM